MISKNIIAAAASIALMATPAMATSASASAASAELAPASETVSGSEIMGGSIIVTVLALIAAGLGLWVLLDDGNNEPNSP